MATPVFQPPPTHTEVILKDAQSRWLFNPAWVKWFLELTQMINNSGGGSGTIQHNSTGGLQGGGTGEYYHLTNQEHGWVADTPAAPTTKFWRGDHTWTGTLAGPFQATNITGTGNLSIQGNTTLGDSTSDTITFTGQMASTLLWGTDNTLDIGAIGANRPRDLYLGRDLYVGGTITITGGIVITGDLTVNGNTTLGNSTVDTLTIASSAITWSGTPTHSGNHTWSGNMTVNGNVTVKGNTAIGDATSDTFTIAPNTVTWTNNPTHSGNHTWSGNMTINGNVVLGDSSTDTLTIATNTVTWSNNPTHSGNHTWSGSMTMNGNVVIGDSSTDTLTIATNAVTWSNNPTHSGTHIITGRLGVGGSLSALTHFYVAGSGLASGVDQGGVYSDCTFTAGATTSEAAFSARTTGAAGSHTTVAAIGLAVADHVLGASQTVTGSYGVLIQNRTAAATLIVGVASQVSSGTGKWNWYSSGTADSSFNGKVRIGSNVAPTVALDVTGSIIASVNLTAWTTWTPTRTGWTDVGAPTVTARYCRIRNAVMFQIKVVPSTTVATVAGTSYTDLPIAAGSSGLAGIGVMGNDTTRVSIGNGEFDIANSRFYVPTQGATANTLQISGWYEV